MDAYLRDPAKRTEDDLKFIAFSKARREGTLSIFRKEIEGCLWTQNDPGPGEGAGAADDTISDAQEMQRRNQDAVISGKRFLGVFRPARGSAEIRALS